jgi:GT2 family glycosyltransferase
MKTNRKTTSSKICCDSKEDPIIITEETDNTNIGTLSDSMHKIRATYRNTPSNRNRPQVSILIFCYNNLHRHTKYCIDSILKYTTDIDYELILLDNGSCDGTLEYFKSVPYAQKKLIKITENKGANYGQHIATEHLMGRYIAMIANDVYVTKNWLSNMIICAESDERIGFIATASDNISNLQAVNLTFDSLEEMQLKAEKHNTSDPRKWEERLRLMPAIAFYKRECLDIVGSLDYAFQHDFSDDDISFRIRRAGYKLVYCGDVFVHHVGSSAAGSVERKYAVLHRGKEIFREKYFGIDAWEDVNNFEPLMLTLVNPQEKRNISKPEVLGIDVMCGTPILQLKNKLRLADIFNTNLSAFVQNPKYWLDLKTICEGTVAVDRIEYLREHFLPGSFDYILLGKPINSYQESDKRLRDMLCLLKEDGQLLIKVSNHIDPKTFLASSEKYLGRDRKNVDYFDIDNLNKSLAREGYSIRTVGRMLYNIDDTTKQAMYSILKSSNITQNIDTVFNELVTAEYALKITPGTGDKIKPLSDKPSAIRGESTNTEIKTSKQLQEHTDDTSSVQYLSISHFHQREPLPRITSIVIVTNNHLDNTKMCVKHILRHTSEPHEIIFVDNASTDGTVEWLQSQVQENKNQYLIENKKNVEQTVGRNQGINKSRGEFIVLIDHDVAVTEGWLSGLLGCLHHAPAAGVVGPMAIGDNDIKHKTESFSSLVTSIDQHASNLREQYRNRRILRRNLDGYCILFRRALIERVGLFDESLGTVQSANEDFCLRASLEGYKNYVAGDIFVRQYDSKDKSVDRKALEKKWILSASSPEGKTLATLRAVEIADEYNQKGNIGRAVETLIDCIKINSEAKEIYYEMVRIFLESKQFTEAWEVIESMPQSTRRELTSFIYAGYVKEGLGLDDEADDYANRVLTQNEHSPAALNLKGVLAYKQGDKEKAVDYFEKAIDNDPGYGEAYTNLGVLCWSLDKKDLALANLKKGFILSPTVPDVSSIYYSVVSSLGAYGDAGIHFREASKLYPNNRNIAFLLIDILIQQTKFRSAMAEIEDALAVFGPDEGTLNAALAVRDKIGPLQIDKTQKENTLSLCMIVKNEEKYLVRCLKSVRDIVNEIIIVDTGSTDRTRDIATVFGAKLFDFPWTGDFAVARNYSLDQAIGDWILILDADEVISGRDFDELKALISRSRPAPGAYSIVTRNYTRNVSVIGWTANDGQYMEEAGSGWAKSIKARLFRRRKDVFFSGPVHEMVEESMRNARISIHPCDIIVHHYGKLDIDLDSQKGEYYYLLGKMKYESDPSNVSYINELAKQAQVLHKYEEAVELWSKLISILKADPESSDYKEIARLSFGEPLPELHIQLASAYLILDRYEEALDAATMAIETKSKLKEYVHIYAHCEIIVGSLSKALRELEELLKTTPGYMPALFLMAVINCLEGKTEIAQRTLQALSRGGLQITPSLNKIAKQLHTHGKKDQAIIILNMTMQNGMNDGETATLLKDLRTEN